MSIQSLMPSSPLARMAMFCSQPLMAATSSSHLRFDELPSGSSIENDWSKRNKKQALFWRLIDWVYGARYMVCSGGFFGVASPCEQARPLPARTGLDLA